MGWHRKHARFAGRLGDLEDHRWIQINRLLDEEMPTGVDHRQRKLAVRRRGRGDTDQIDVRMIDELECVFTRRDLTRIEETVTSASIKVSVATAVARQSRSISIRDRHDSAT